MNIRKAKMGYMVIKENVILFRGSYNECCEFIRKNANLDDDNYLGKGMIIMFLFAFLFACAVIVSVLINN